MNLERLSVLDLPTGRRHVAIQRVPSLSSSGGPWRGFLIEQHANTSIDLIEKATTDHRLVVQLEDEAVVEIRDGGHYRPYRLGPGFCMIFPSMMPVSARTRASGGFIAIGIQPSFLRLAAHRLLDGNARTELVHHAGIEDPLIAAVAHALIQEVKADYQGGSTYGESLANSLAVHLVRHYSPNGHRPPGPEPSAGSGQIQTALNYIQENLSRDIPLQTLAAQVGLSPFHFARQFKVATGIAPHQYIIRLRVKKARELLVTTQRSSVEIAVDLGFCDQSHLTVHFKRAYGITPAEFRRREGWRKSLEPAVPAAEANR